MRWHLIVAVLILTGSPAQAEPVTLGGDTLKQALAGKTVHLDTPFGVAIPITFHGNGLMSGNAGILAYFLGGEVDRGRWWVADGKLCQKWFKWLDAQPSCMRLQQDGHRIFWQRDDGVSGTATIASALPPGAEMAPHGLGGPAVTPEPHPPLTTTDLSEAAKPTNTSMPQAALTRAAKPLAPRTAALVAHPQLQAPPTRADDQPKSRHDHRQAAPMQSAAWSGPDDRWCHASGPIGATSAPATELGAAPDLILVARLGYAGSEMPSSTTACLTVEPALHHVAKLGTRTR